MASLPTVPDSAGDEPELVRRATGGDVQAFEALYHRHVGRVYAVCLRMCDDRERARELAHDAFVRAWERLSTFRGDSAFGTWLHRLAVNQVLETLRGERRRRAREVAAGEDDEGEAPTLRMVRHDEGLRMDLEEAIRRLPPNARQVFVLHEVEGYRHEEIARSMGTAEGTVRAHLHRARRLLMEFLSR